MTLTVEAVYENGVLRPLAPLPFSEAQKVHVQVWAEPPLSESNVIEQILANAGLVRPQSEREDVPNPITTAERRRLADLLGRIPENHFQYLSLKSVGSCGCDLPGYQRFAKTVRK